MAAAAPHRCDLLASPWPGVFGTCIDSARHFGRHLHGTYGIGLLEQGAQHSASGRGPVEAYAGDLITTNPGEVHDGRPLGGPSRRWRMVYLDPAAMAGWAGVPGVAGMAVTRPVIRDTRLAAAVGRLLGRLQAWQAAGAAHATGTLACEEALADACGLLRACHSTARAEPEAATDVARVRERLADDLLATPTLDELAALAGVSRYQVQRRFVRVHGLPPHAWLLQWRAERARTLIRAGHGLADAALACGFADQSHMTRVFTRQFGYTPGAWRQAMAPQ